MDAHTIGYKAFFASLCHNSVIHDGKSIPELAAYALPTGTVKKTAVLTGLFVPAVDSLRGV
jgi:hypothetical protein